MSGTWGNNLKVSIFGESHGAAIGINIDGLPAGIPLDMEGILKEMARRAPGQSALSTARKEADQPEILSGLFGGFTTGVPLCAIIRNGDTKSKDYELLKDNMRPGHADFSGSVRYFGYNDYRGSGHFSGRITAPLVFAGAVCKQVLAVRGIIVGGHIQSIAGIRDDSLNPVDLSPQLLDSLKESELPLLDETKGTAMREAILAAKGDGNSVGGIVECAVVGLPAGVGDPFFDSVESVLSHLLFSVPAIKGVEFGLGFAMADQTGIECNDSLYYDGDQVKTRTNNNGGILGGITNGMPVVFRAAVKPTSSIAKEQHTVNIREHKDTVLIVPGRHDPCIVQRAVPVIEAVTAIGILDLIKGRDAWQG